VKRIKHAVVAVLVTSTMSVVPAPAMAQKHERRDRHEDRRYDDRRYDDRDDRHRPVPRAWRNYDERHYEPGQRRYDPARYYRSGGRYQPYRLGRNDRIYRGYDNRYYCRRDDGTTGLIIGGMAGGVLGNIITPGGYKTLGTILGAGAGALIGREIDDGVECR
jgi:Glycine zipper 2TM domain